MCEPEPLSALACVNAMILAGGKGTRLRSVIGHRQKVVANVGGRPFLLNLLEQLNRHGLRKVILCTGFKGEQVAETIGYRYKSLHLSYSCEPAALGTGGALKYAADRLDSEIVLVMNGDSYCPIHLSRLYQWHQQNHARSTLVLAQVPNVARYGQVCLDSHSKITRFNEKGEQTGPGWISAGIYLLNRLCIDNIAADRNVSIEHDVFPLMVGSGLYGYKSTARFIDIGTPESYSLAQKQLNATT